MKGEFWKNYTWWATTEILFTHELNEWIKYERTIHLRFYRLYFYAVVSKDPPQYHNWMKLIWYLILNQISPPTLLAPISDCRSTTLIFHWQSRANRTRVISAACFHRAQSCTEWKFWTWTSRLSNRIMEANQEGGKKQQKLMSIFQIKHISSCM